MVIEKFQFRSSGSIDIVTHQPKGGRKRGGGVRFGEMEKDAMISHGAIFNLNDRILISSDNSTCLICSSCGSISSVINKFKGSFKFLNFSKTKKSTTKKNVCSYCNSSQNITI